MSGSKQSSRPAAQARESIGVPGLDDVLGGGLPSNRMYLVQGTPGVGKTTLSLQFLMDGAKRGERVLYITLSETKEEILAVAESHGFSLDGVDLFELSTAEQTLRLNDENTLYATEDVELRETMKVLLGEVERIAPSRVVFDSLSEIRLLAQTPVRYRRQLLALKQHFAGRNTTVLLLDDRSDAADVQVESLAHGVIVLEQSSASFGADRRRLRVSKLRGSEFRSGYHDFVVKRGGLKVFPRLVAAEHRSELPSEVIPSGVAALDALLGGGVVRGTTSLFVGPAGAGKSIIASQFLCAAAARGERGLLFLFEERVATFLERSKGLGLPVRKYMDEGLIRVQQIDASELAPDEFTDLVRREIDEHDAKLAVIDSINGYFSAMPEGRFLTLQIHELLTFLGSRGVATIFTLAQSGVIGTMSSPVDVSYLADNVLLFRYFEAEGRARKALSVIKKRSGYHEDTIREMRVGKDGVDIGPPLREFRGVLTGVPELVRLPPSIKKDDAEQ